MTRRRSRFIQVHQPLLTGAVLGWITYSISGSIAPSVGIGLLLFVFLSFKSLAIVVLSKDYVVIRVGVFGVMGFRCDPSDLRLRLTGSTVKISMASDRRLGLFKTIWYFENPLFMKSELCESFARQYPRSSQTF